MQNRVKVEIVVKHPLNLLQKLLQEIDLYDIKQEKNSLSV